MYTPKTYAGHASSKKKVEIANEHMKRCCTSLVVRRKQIKTTIQITLKKIVMLVMKLVHFNSQ